MNVHIISLGCDKNRINAEQMLFKLIQAGHVHTDFEEAEAVLINTCGFIEQAKSEAIDTILEAAKYKTGLSPKGHIKYIVVSGCLSERYREEVLEELPEVDAVLGTGRFDDIAVLFDELLTTEKPAFFGGIDGAVSETPRVRTGLSHTAYVKIAEGCGNACAYCVIPRLRGRYRSRPLEMIENEVLKLAEEGVREIILVAQDVTAYGTDLYGKRALPELLERLSLARGISWIRLHYLYPELMDSEMIRSVGSVLKVLPYFDIPIQHINAGILKKMRRRAGPDAIKETILKIRSEIPEAVLRTSIICGFPGEGEAEFQELCEFLKEYRIERAGFFAFSPEEGTPAADMPGRPCEETVEKRLAILSDIQSRVMDEFDIKRQGKIFETIIDEFLPDTGLYFGRTRADSPEVDPGVLVRARRPLVPGELIDVKITGRRDGSLLGEY